MSTNINISEEEKAKALAQTTATAGALRYDGDKPKLDLLSPIAMEGTAAILTFGAKKYAAHNWRKGMLWSRAIGSLMRHLFAYLRGEDLDPESGLPHIDHIACNVMFLQEYYRTSKHLDDRYKPDTKEEKP